MYGPDKVQRVWNRIVQFYKSKYSKDDAIYLSDFMIKEYLKQTYKEFVQTRKTASYGYFQMLYTTAILKETGYPRNPGNYPSPEKMNDQDILTTYVLRHLKNNMVDILKKHSKNFNDNNWNSGYEEEWFNSYHAYNGRPGYASDILMYSNKFLPK